MAPQNNGVKGELLFCFKTWKQKMLEDTKKLHNVLQNFDGEGEIFFPSSPFSPVGIEFL